MKNHCGESVGFSFGAALWFRLPVILFTRSFLNVIIRPIVIFTVKCNDSVSFSFLFPCFLVFFFVKDQIASFQLKQIIVFFN